MSETTQKESNGTANDSKSPKDEKEKKSSLAFNDMLSNRMEVEVGNVEPKGSSNVSSSKSKIKLLVGGIVFVILIIIIIVLMLPKTLKQNDSQLWRFTKESSKLDNLYSSSWKFEDNMWTLPSDEDKEGYIEVKDSKMVLAINGEDVELEDKVENSASSQIWIRGSKNSEGYFSLKNKKTGKFLTVCIHTSQLWSLTNDSRLNNLYSSEDNKWTPLEGTEGYIEVTDKEGKIEVLAINDTEVVLENKTETLTNSQKWIKGLANSDDYFTLKNKGTGEFLQGERNPMISVKDFILGEDFDGSLGVGSSYGINVGGASITSGPNSNGVRGCTGKLIITPPFKKGDIEKTKEDGFGYTAWIWANKKTDGYQTTKITVQGTCCWEIYHRLGESQKDLKPGQTLAPSVAYIRKLKTKKC